MRMPPIAAATLFAAALAIAPPAGADMGPKWEQALFLPLGLNLGAANHPKRESSFLIGGDASVVYINDQLFWTGGFADALADVSNKSFRYCLGPEIGWLPIGLDTGYLGEVSP